MAKKFDAPEEIAESKPSKLFSVEIPLCLLGEQKIEADTAEDAFGKYKAMGGIISSEHQPRISEINREPNAE